MPVVVRASETTEGRARLVPPHGRPRPGSRPATPGNTRPPRRTHRCHGSGRRRPRSAPAALTALLESRAPDRDPASLLFGPAPTDDAGLVRLADQLDALEREVRTS
ncbi:hypothetical protein ACFQVA_26980 [Actinomadura keratinilytica]